MGVPRSSQYALKLIIYYYSFQLVPIKLSFSGHKMITPTTKMLTVCLVLALLRPAVAEVNINKLASGQTIYVRMGAKKVVPAFIQMLNKSRPKLMVSYVRNDYDNLEDEIYTGQDQVDRFLKTVAFSRSAAKKAGIRENYDNGQDGQYFG